MNTKKLVESIRESFEIVPDPRKERTRAHDLGEMLVMALIATLCGADGFVGIELFCKSRLDWFRTFLVLENGVASHDTFGRVFAELMSHREPLPYLGDLMFHALLRPLIDSSTPLLREHDVHLPWPQRPLELTGLGRQVLGGERYWLDQDAPERWVGGVRLRAGQPHWALDDGLRPVWKD